MWASSGTGGTAGFLGSNSRKLPNTPPPPQSPAPTPWTLEEPGEELLEPRQRVELCGEDPQRVRSFVQVSGSPQHPSWEEARKAISNSLSSCPPFPAGTSHRPTQVGAQWDAPPGCRAGRGWALRGRGRSLPPLGALNGGHGRCRHSAHSSTKGLLGAGAGGSRSEGKCFRFLRALSPSLNTVT